MDYKKIIGYGKKKKVKKEQTKPKVNQVLESIKEEFGYKDNVNEGPAADYEKVHQRLKKAYYAFNDAYLDFQRLLINKGLKPYGRQLDRAYKGVDKFWKFYNNLLDKLQ